MSKHSALYCKICSYAPTSGPRTCVARIGIIMAAVLIAGCFRETDHSAADSSQKSSIVYTTAYPVYYFASRIGIPDIQVKYPLPDSVDPHAWTPSPAIIQEYQTADLILVNGGGMEQWMRQASIPFSKRVDTTSGFAEQLLEYADEITHSHGPDGQHSHYHQKNPYAWLDPALARKQSEAIYKALANAWPEHENALHERYDALRSDLKTLEDSLRKLSPPIPPSSILITHPAFHYLAQALEWDVKAVDMDFEHPITAPTWKKLQTLADLQQPRLMLCHEELPQPFSQPLTDKLAIRPLFFDIGLRPPGGTNDFLSTMRANYARLEKALQSMISTK